MEGIIVVKIEAEFMTTYHDTLATAMDELQTTIEIALMERSGSPIHITFEAMTRDEFDALPEAEV